MVRQACIHTLLGITLVINRYVCLRLCMHRCSHLTLSDTTFNLLYAVCVKGDRGSTVVKVLCCATNQKVAGSIPAGVTGIFH